MKISRLAIENYRCIGNIEIEIDDYSAFIGANGAGKSSILYGLAWFFGARPVVKEDRNKVTDSESGRVAITFSNLTDRDRRLLGQFGRGKSATLTRCVNFESLNETFS